MKILTICAYVLAIVAIATGDFKKVGETLTLTPDISSFSEPIKSILWKHGENKAVELDRDFYADVDYYGDFKGRTILDTQTGRLDISHLRTLDTGVYSLHLNSKPQPITFDIKVIKEVPEPRITVECETPSCTLTCEGDSTGAGPVTYSWRGGEKELNVTDKKLTVPEADHQTQTYTCQMKNPVSQKESNIQSTEKTGLFVGIGILAALVVVGAAVGKFVLPKCKSGGWSFAKVPGGNNEANKERVEKEDKA